MTQDYRSLPPDLPAPEDDGAADHLTGLAVPSVRLASTLGGEVDLAAAAAGPGRLVVYVYPRTGKPGEPLIEGWDEIPGARGCTPQNAAFRDQVTDFAALGATLLGVSAQSPEDQAEFAAREAIPYPLLSDEGLELAREINFDLYILDVRLPDGTGVELCQKLRALNSEIPILYYSAYGDEADHQNALQTCGDAYLKKPVCIADIQETIARLLAAATQE